MSESLLIPQGLLFDERGLIPAIVQSRGTGEILMVAWANADALRLTAETRRAHFWSRSRQELWLKGAASGNGVVVDEIRTDCDRDVLLYVGEASGPACHTGARSCFGEKPPTDAAFLESLASTIRHRRTSDPTESYTARLFAKGQNAILKKVGEEATEVVLALQSESEGRVAEESADLLFHLLVALELRGVPLSAVIEVLRSRQR